MIVRSGARRPTTPPWKVMRGADDTRAPLLALDVQRVSHRAVSAGIIADSLSVPDVMKFDLPGAPFPWRV